MNQASRLSPLKRVKRLAFWCLILLSTGLFSGCSRPTDDNIIYLLQKTYQCEGIEVVDMIRTDSLPGIFTYVGEYNFLVRLEDGEEEALSFYRRLIKLTDVKGNDWQAGLYAPKLQDHLLDKCSEAGQTVVETMLEDVFKQLSENQKQIKLPIAIQMNGWSEFMPSSNKEGGWAMTIRRDRFGEEMAYGKPVSREALLRGTGKR